MKFNTKTIHGGQEPDPAYGSVMPPIYQTTTYAQTTPGVHKGYAYSRSHNPTRNALENAFTSIENGNFGLAFGSGLAAIDAVLKLLKSGDEVISNNDLYGGTYRLFTSIFEKFGIKFHFVDMVNTSNIEKHVNENTKLIWVETPTNPMMNIIDIKATAAIAKRHNILLAVDNTFATPYLQQPLDLGADIVMHSATKYLGGHSDVVMGGLVVKDKGLADKLDIADRMYKLTKREAHLTIKDHKEDFRNNPKCRPINPTKSETGKVSRQILRAKIELIKRKTKLDSLKDSNYAKTWYTNLQQKHNLTFISMWF